MRYILRYDAMRRSHDPHGHYLGPKTCKQSYPFEAHDDAAAIAEAIRKLDEENSGKTWAYEVQNPNLVQERTIDGLAERISERIY